MEMSAWDHALADQTNKLVDQLLPAGEEIVPRQSLLPIMQRLRRFVQDTAGQREASPVLATTLQLVLNPCLDKLYPQDGDDAITKELLETLCELCLPVLNFVLVDARVSNSLKGVLACRCSWPRLPQSSRADATSAYI